MTVYFSPHPTPLPSPHAYVPLPPSSQPPATLSSTISSFHLPTTIKVPNNFVVTIQYSYMCVIYNIRFASCYDVTELFSAIYRWHTLKFVVILGPNKQALSHSYLICKCYIYIFSCA